MRVLQVPTTLGESKKHEKLKTPGYRKWRAFLCYITREEAMWLGLLKTVQTIREYKSPQGELKRPGTHMVTTMTLWHLLHSSESIIEVAFAENLCIHKVTLIHTTVYPFTFAGLNFHGFHASEAICVSFISWKFRPVWERVCICKTIASQTCKNGGDSL